MNSGVVSAVTGNGAGPPGKTTPFACPRGPDSSEPFPGHEAPGHEVGAGRFMVPGVHGGSVLDRRFQVLLHGVPVPRADQGPYVGVGLAARAEPQRPGPVRQPLDQRVRHLPHRHHPAGGGAPLPGLAECGGRDCAGGQLEVGVGEHHRGVLAAISVCSRTLVSAS